MTNNLKISLILCTHNPRKDYLRETINGLKRQDLAYADWELLLIDNASNPAVKSQFDLSWHPNGRIIREEILGLTVARLTGITRSKGDIIVFADDDNILAKNYLTTTLFIAEKWPKIGAWGGSNKGQFEIEPPAHLSKFLIGLAVEEIKKDYWSNIPIWSRAVPFGAGLCVRREIAKAHANKVGSDKLRKQLGRTGSGLGAAEDTDLAFTACDLGYGTGRFTSLNLTHLIPASRLNDEYIARLFGGFMYSNTILKYLREGVAPIKPTTGLRGKIAELRFLLSLRKLDSFTRKRFVAEYKGRIHAAIKIQESIAIEKA